MPSARAATPAVALSTIAVFLSLGLFLSQAATSSAESHGTDTLIHKITAPMRSPGERRGRDARHATTDFCGLHVRPRFAVASVGAVGGGGAAAVASWGCIQNAKFHYCRFLELDFPIRTVWSHLWFRVTGSYITRRLLFTRCGSSTRNTHSSRGSRSTCRFCSSILRTVCRAFRPGRVS